MRWIKGGGDEAERERWKQNQSRQGSKSGGNRLLKNPIVHSDLQQIQSTVNFHDNGHRPLKADGCVSDTIASSSCTLPAGSVQYSHLYHTLDPSPSLTVTTPRQPSSQSRRMKTMAQTRMPIIIGPRFTLTQGRASSEPTRFRSSIASLKWAETGDRLTRLKSSVWRGRLVRRR